MSPVDCLAPPRATISRAEAQADLAVVRRIVHRGWSGYEETLRAGWDLDTLLDGIGKAIDAFPEPIPTPTFAKLLATRMHGAGDNHMAVWEFGKEGWSHYASFGLHQRAYTAELTLTPRGSKVVTGPVPAGAELFACEGIDNGALFRRSVDAELAPILRPIVLSEKPPAPLRCTFRLADGTAKQLDVPMRRLEVKGPPEDEDVRFLWQDGPIPRLRIRSFSSRAKSSLEELVAIAPRMRDARAIVADVRGNGGGNDVYATDFFVGLTAGKLAYPPVERLDSEVTLQGDINMSVCDASFGTQPEGRLERARDVLAKAKAEHGGAPFRTWVRQRFDQDGKAPRPFRAPFVALVDNACASSCESFVQYVPQLPYGLVVGENTAGVGVFGEVRQYRLPKSGLGFSAGRKYFHDEGTSEGRGRLPDLWLDTKDAPALALRIAECLARQDCPILRP